MGTRTERLYDATIETAVTPPNYGERDVDEVSV
jgi:hypothetical protein